MASFRSEAEAFPGMSGMAEGHDRYARGLKPRALDRGVVHLPVNYFLHNGTELIIQKKFCIARGMVDFYRILQNSEGSDNP